MSLSTKPQDINKSAWYYEQEDGLCVVIEAKDSRGNTLGLPVMATIPWSQIRKSLHAKDKKKQRRGNAREDA